MNKHHKTLELDKILLLLSKETSCSDSAEAALNLTPSDDKDEILKLLKQTDDAYVFLSKFGAPSFYGLKNTKNPLRRAEVGGVLSLVDLISIDATLRVIRGVKEWKSKSESATSTIDYYFQSLTPNKYIEDRISTTVKSEEEVADSASPELANIRRKINRASLNIKEQLDKMVRSSHYQKYLQEYIVTQRDGRYVVPVKSEHKNEVKGLVHDSSSSGSTLFIEPMAVVEANNEIRLLKSLEQEEINRILTVLSAEIGTFSDDIIKSYDILVKLNLIFAKAHLAYKMKAVVPLFDDDGKVLLKSARHPLIDPKHVVPTDINLGYDFDSLIITGPNTGGKTVCLKTLGLFSLMAMCGLMVPCAEGSKLSFFSKILVDIGDEQSIEQSLSTFSSHMTNIIGIIEKADNKSLVLIDELGAGTDPIEGAALACAIIESLRIKKLRLAATTHYAELKEYALKTDGVENACCEFDVNTLSPTYKLLIGIPGKSNAFSISKKLGMRNDIVERAKNLVSENSSQFEVVVEKLEESRKALENEKSASEKLRKQAELELAEAKKIKESAEKESKNALESAKYQASLIVSSTRAQADELMDKMDKLKKMNANSLKDYDKFTLKSSIRNLESSSNPVEERKKEDYKLPRELKIGDDVIIFDIDKRAVVTAINKNKITVQAGIIKTTVDISNLRLAEKKEEKSKKTGFRTVSKTISTESLSMNIDIRGMNCDEGIMELDSYLDRAVRQGLHEVTIIHGKGTGVLRTAIRQHLKRHPSIRSFRPGVFGEGEDGVTVAEIK